MKKIVTLMNFIRGSELRLEMDLFGATKSQLKLTENTGTRPLIFCNTSLYEKGISRVACQRKPAYRGGIVTGTLPRPCRKGGLGMAWRVRLELLSRSGQPAWLP